MFAVGIVFIGISSGLFFVYDSFNKLVLGQVSEYAKLAHEYSVNQAGQLTEESNQFRIDVHYRSFGLLERHSVSGLWIALGFFAFAFLRSNQNKLLDYGGFFLFLLLIIFGINFASLIAFVVTAFLLYRKYLSFKISLYFISISIVVAVLSFLYMENIWIMASTAYSFIPLQITYLTNYGAVTADEGFLPIILIEFHRYCHLIFEEPWTAIIGFGIGTHAEYSTSGDIGYLETLARFGIPLSFVFVIYILNVLRTAINWLKYRDLVKEARWQANMAVFSASVLLTVVIMDVHYTVWVHKSVAPIIAFAMALSSRPRGVPAGVDLPQEYDVIFE
jgi:hypothetical protein